MKRRPFLPSPIALLSAVLTFVLLGFFVAAAAAVVPQLLELMKTQPRLAMIGLLGFTISPAFVTVLVHHVGHRALDKIDTDFDWRDRRNKGPALFPTIESWWAGVQAWMTLYAASIVTRLVMLVIFPPEPRDPGAESLFSLTGLVNEMAGAVTLHNAPSLHTGIWIVIAAWMYELERRASRRRHKHEE